MKLADTWQAYEMNSIEIELVKTNVKLELKLNSTNKIRKVSGLVSRMKN